MAHLERYLNVSPAISPDAYAAPTATLVGAVRVGAGSSIWHGTVLRGDVEPITVGDRTSIQDNSVVHSSRGWQPVMIGDDVTVGHAVIVHGCVIRDRVLLGMGSIVLDGADIGPDVLLGAGSLVTARSRLPPGTLAFGRPAKVVRELTDEERASILESAAHYVRLAADYRRGSASGPGSATGAGTVAGDER